LPFLPVGPWWFHQPSCCSHRCLIREPMKTNRGDPHWFGRQGETPDRPTYLRGRLGRASLPGHSPNPSFVIWSSSLRTAPPPERRNAEAPKHCPLAARTTEFAASASTANAPCYGHQAKGV
jgi:hypothetical protein